MKVYCELPFHRIKIDTDGKYQSCCHQAHYYGNFLTDNISVEEAFNRDDVREVKLAVLSNKLHSSCNNTKCPLYYTNLEKNVDVGVGKLPRQIEFALPSTWCNIGGINPTSGTACIMCPRSSKTFMDTQKIDNTDKLLEIIKPVLPSLGSLSILGVAEPFWKGRLFDVFDKLEFKKYKDTVFFWTYSNGTIFNKKLQDKFIKEYTEKTCVGFSIDAVTPETYKKIRRLNYYPTIVKNLENYFNEMDRFLVKRDWSFVSHNINMMNLHEMEDMVRFSNDIGANKIQFTLTYVAHHGIRLDSSLMCNENNWEQFWETAQRAEQVAKELNQEIEFYVPFHKGFLK